MGWDFTTEPEFQAKLDWMDEFVRDEIEPLDLLFPHLTYRRIEDPLKVLVDQLKGEVRSRDLWACHLGPDLGGQGYGQLKLALMNEILGRSAWAPIVFGTQAPDTGNAEIIAAYGTPEQKERWLKPLLNGEVFSCYSMTEPQGGSDPTQFRTQAVRDGDEWVITGEKFFSSNLREASFLIVMAVTNPDVSPYQGMSMFLVPSDSPGIRVLANIGLGNEACTRTFAMRPCGSPTRTSSGARVRPLPWPNAGSAGAGSTTPCGPSPARSGSSTCSASGCSAGPPKAAFSLPSS